ncbi:3-hydroxyacyl-ACP dehydratase FabZ family protein [Aquimarina sp. W85]|uniref:3-hydroxyacyl-ACP dehydratase FabZ family protein n=1 Tax=Aquimarina rhodophyticola TaxID=3342246 RepID=UPI00366E084C
MSNANILIKKLPYSRPFLFVDAITEINDTGIIGNYTFRKDEFFYKGHFKDNPVTPGVILTECMAQIGLVAYGITLLPDTVDTDTLQIAFTSSQMNFYRPVYPADTVWVKSTKQYFRFGKLQCEVAMYNANDTLIAKGVLAGMFKVNNTDE